MWGRESGNSAALVKAGRLARPFAISTTTKRMPQPLRFSKAGDFDCRSQGVFR